MSKLFNKFRPSSSKRQLTCTKSIQLEYLNPTKDNGSVMATRGNDIHKLAENTLFENLFGVVTTTSNTITEHDDFKEYQHIANEYQKYIHIINDSFDDDNFISAIEHNVPLKYLHEGFDNKKGAIDYLAHDDTILHIVDLKTGYTPVSAKDNYQLYIYAYAYLKSLENEHIKDISIHIFQKTMLDNNTNMVTLSVAELEKFIQDKVLDVLDDIDIGILNYVTGDHCKYCPFLKSCKQVANKSYLTVHSDNLGINDRVEIFKLKNIIIKQLNDIEEDLTDIFELTDVEDLPIILKDNLELKRGRNSRQFINQSELEDKLLSVISEDILYDRKFISPFALEKYIKLENMKLDFNLKKYINSVSSNKYSLKVKK